jgi:hypothetical protein
MKNTIVSALAAAILAAVLISCFARAADYQSMTDEELVAEANAIRNEQVKRKAAEEEKPVVFDQDGVQVYLTGNYKMTSTNLKIEAVVVNETDRTLDVLAANNRIAINGWECFSLGIPNTGPGKKQKGEFNITFGQSDISKYEEIEDISFKIDIFDMSSLEFVSKGEEVVVYYN